MCVYIVHEIFDHGSLMKASWRTHSFFLLRPLSILLLGKGRIRRRFPVQFSRSKALPRRSSQLQNPTRKKEKVFTASQGKKLTHRQLKRSFGRRFLSCHHHHHWLTCLSLSFFSKGIFPSHVFDGIFISLPDFFQKRRIIDFSVGLVA